MTARHILLVAVGLSVAACKSEHGVGADGPMADRPPSDAAIAGPALVFSVQPTSAIAGAPLSVAVQVQVDGVTQTDSTATITLADPFDIVQGTTSVSAANGVATFDDLYFWQAASGYTLTASTAGYASATSATFDITLAVPSTLSLFGIDRNQLTSPYPSPSPGFGLERLWNSGVQWSKLDPPPGGQYSFDKLEQYLKDLKAHGVDEALYTFGDTPSWAQTAVADFPSDVPTAVPGDCRDADSGEAGSCFPPNDLAWDGTGTNLAWKNFVTALVTHVNGLDPNVYARIHYWEVWNEPDASPTLIAGGPSANAAWWGSYAQLVRMAEDARCIIKGVGTIHSETAVGSARPCNATAIDPDAMILSPSTHPYPGTNGKYKELSVGQNFLHCTNAPNSALAPPPTFAACPNASNWGSDAVDAINMHMKIAVDADGPELMVDYMNRVRAILTPAERTKPIFNDEAGFGDGHFAGQSYTYDDIKEAFVARYFFLQWGNVALVDWFTWENVANAKDAGCGLFEIPAKMLNGAGIAYATTFNWISGATLTKPCSSAVVAGDTIWTCGFTNAGASYEAIWDTSVPCDADTKTCATKNVAVDAGWTGYQDITGASHAITGGTVPIGKKVIVLSR